MGLSGPRKRAKFSHDPNNTNWSRSESKYGQRILQAQGWKPGDYLGAKNASHAKFHTGANSSHIKVALRNENLGLGARVGAAGGEWETTGLDGFQDLLGRLNGKSEEEIKKVQNGREVRQKNLYIERRWGTLQFVSGGLLVGDRAEEPRDQGESEELPLEQVISTTEESGQLATGQDDLLTEVSKSKRKKKSTKSRMSEEISPPMRGDREKSDETHGAAIPATAVLINDKRQRQAEKMKRKLLRKERREAAYKASPLPVEEPKAAVKELKATVKEPKATVKELKATVEEPKAVDEEPKAAVEIAASEVLRSGIHTVRQRHIRQKRMAMMNSKALKEILMIKT